jgi:FkbM family methyltransferase
MFSLIRKTIARGTPFFIRKRIPIEISKHFYFSGQFKARLYGEKVATLISTGNQIENEIYWKGFEGCHEGLSTQIWASIIVQTRPGIIWDIGANSGTYGVLAKSIFPGCEVSFFEPIPKAVKMIEQNLILNRIDASVFQLALGDYDGEGEIYFAEGADFATSVTVNKDTTSDQTNSVKMEIKVLRAESILKQHKIPLPNLVKLDVETFEPEVLNGFGTSFPHDAIFLIEVLTHDKADQLSQFFPSADYDFFNIDDAKNSFRKTTRLEKSDFYNYLILPKATSIQFNFDRVLTPITRSK